MTRRHKVQAKAVYGVTAGLGREAFVGTSAWEADALASISCKFEDRQMDTNQIAIVALFCEIIVLCIYIAHLERKIL